MTREDRERRGEELLRAVLHGERLEGEDAAERAMLESFLGSCREAAAACGDEPELALRALASSTREDLSWRGDLQVALRFVHGGLRASALLRLAAASLLLHLAALPVVAYYLLREAPPLPEFRVETGRPPLPFAAASADGMEPQPDLDIPDLGGSQVLLVDNTLSWSRWQLSQREDPITRREDPVDAAGGDAPEWLRARVAVLWRGAPVEWSGANLSATCVEVLALERALDQHLVGVRSEGVDGEELGSAPAGRLDAVAAMVGDSSAASSWLAAATLARAESYGWNTVSSAAALERARSSFSSGHRLRALIEAEGDLRGRLPLDALWVEVLREVEPASISLAWLERLRSWGAEGEL